MTVTWPKTLAKALSALVVTTFALLLALGFVAINLNDAADDLQSIANRQQEALDGQEDARQRSECLTNEYKEFFAGVAQALFAVAEDEPIPPDAVDRLEHAAEVLPMIDERCSG